MQHEELVAEGIIENQNGKHPEEQIAEMVNRFIQMFTTVRKK